MGEHHWHIRLGDGPWGHGRWGWRPAIHPNMGGGISLGWWQVQVWTTRG